MVGCSLSKQSLSLHLKESAEVENIEEVQKRCTIRWCATQSSQIQFLKGESVDEMWRRRQIMRHRQIIIGKATPEYKRYILTVPKNQREIQHPMTPDMRVSKRRFDRDLRAWRVQLHNWHRTGEVLMQHDRSDQLISSRKSDYDSDFFVVKTVDGRADTFFDLSPMLPLKMPSQKLKQTLPQTPPRSLRACRGKIGSPLKAARHEYGSTVPQSTRECHPDVEQASHNELMPPSVQTPYENEPIWYGQTPSPCYEYKSGVPKEMQESVMTMMPIPKRTDYVLWVQQQIIYMPVLPLF